MTPERFEQLLDAEVPERAAEEHRRHVAFPIGLRIEGRRGAAHQLTFLQELLALAIVERARQGVVGQIGAVDRGRPLGLRVEHQKTVVGQVVAAAKTPSHSDRPGHRHRVERQVVGDLVDDLERIARFHVQLVDEGHDRQVAQPADLQQLSSLGLDALGRIDHHHRRIDRGQRPVGVSLKSSWPGVSRRL